MASYERSPALAASLVTPPRLKAGISTVQVDPVGKGTGDAAAMALDRQAGCVSFAPAPGRGVRRRRPAHRCRPRLPASPAYAANLQTQPGTGWRE
jgi:hypothetical protein